MKRILVIAALPFVLLVVLFLVLVTTGLPLGPMARAAIRRAHLAPLEVTVDAARLKWMLPATLRLTTRNVRAFVPGGDPVAAWAAATIDLPVGRLLARRVLPSAVVVSAPELWLRATPAGRLALTIPPEVLAQWGSEPKVEKTVAGTAAFTLAGLSPAFWLPDGRETKINATGIRWHVLPVAHGQPVWDSPVLALHCELVGNAHGMVEKATLHNASGAVMLTSECELQPAAEAITLTTTVPNLPWSDALAYLPPDFRPTGFKAEGAAHARLQARAQLPFPKQIDFDWTAGLSPARLTLPGQSKPVEIPETTATGTGTLKGTALVTTLRVASGGSAPWADLRLEAKLDLASLQGSVAFQSPGIDLGRLATLAPPVPLSFAGATPVRLEGGADLNLRSGAVENAHVKVDVPAAQWEVNGRRLDTPAANLALTGRVGPGFPRCEAEVVSEFSASLAENPMTISSHAEWDGRTGILRAQSKAAPFDAGLLLRYLPRLPAGTRMALPVSWNVEGELDTRATVLRRAKASVDLGAGSLAVPDYLSAPLALAPCRLAAEVTDQGAVGKLEPFVWSAGPLRVSCEGGGWNVAGESLSGMVGLALGRVKFADVLGLLSAKLRAELPAESRELGDLAIEKFSWRTRIAGAWQKGGPVFRNLEGEGVLDLTMGREPFQLLLNLRAPLPAGRVHAELIAPDFVQARWSLPLLSRLPVPAVDAPVSARLEADFDLPWRLQAARWRVEAGEGRILPRGLLADWLGQPLPLKRFVVGGRVGPDLSRLDIDEFLLESGRARCRFEQFAIDLGTQGEIRHLRAGGRMVLENWYAEDFLPRLAHPVLETLPENGAAMEDLGLENFTASLEAALAIDGTGRMTIESMKQDGRCSLRIGDQSLPLVTTAGYDPAARQVFVRTDIADLRLARFRPRVARNLPVALAAFDFPVALSLEARTTVPDNFPKQQPSLPDLRLVVRGGPGVIHQCDYLAAETPLRSFELEAESSLVDLTLKSLRAACDFDGPKIAVDSLRATFGKEWSTEAAVRATDVPLAWVLARVPAGLVPLPARDWLPKLAVGGLVRNLRVSVGAKLPAEAAARLQINTLALETTVEQASVKMAEWPMLSCDRLQITGDVRSMRAVAGGIVGGAVQVSRLDVGISDVLGKKPMAAGTLTVAMRLGELRAFLHSLPAPVALPEAMDWSTLAGDLKAEVALEADLLRLPDLAALTADARVKVAGFVPPVIPGGVETMPGSLDARFRLKDSVPTAEGSLRAELRRAFGAAEGPVSATFQVRGELTGKADATMAVDFTGAHLRTPNLTWDKPAGREAGLTLTMTTPDFHLPDGAGSATFDLAGKGVLYERLRIQGRLDGRLASAQRPATVNLVCDSIEADETSLRLAASATWPQSLNLTMEGPRFDLRPLVRLSAPWWASFNAPSPAPANETASATPMAGAVPASAPAPVTSVGSGPATPGAALAPTPASSYLPAETTVSVAFNEVVLGGGRSLESWQAHGHLRGSQLVSADVSFSSNRHAFTADLRPGSTLPVWSAKTDDITDLWSAGVAPLRELPPEQTTESTFLGELIHFSDMFAGGVATADGTLDLGQPVTPVRGRVQVDALTLRSQIPFLSSIAALVKRPVVLSIPFKVSRAESFEVGLTEAHVHNAFLDGPIDLFADKFDYDFTKSTLFLRGKVFGIWFEVMGPYDKLSFYLSDKNKALRTITTEDDFKW